MENNPNFKFYLPGKSENLNLNILVADLRKYESTLAICKIEGGQVNLVCEETFKTNDYSSFIQIIDEFRLKCKENFSRVSVAVPGPVISGKCRTMHLPWELDAEEIKNHTAAEDAYLINDLEANAYGLSDLKNSEVVAIHTPGVYTNGNMAILAPGNGLGEAGLFFDGEHLRPFATEGGHTEFSPRNKSEVEFYEYLRSIYGIVSWEKVLSKDGLYNIYRFLRDIERHKEHPEFSAEIQSGNFVNAILKYGNTKESTLVNLTLQKFSEMLAREANCLALKLKAIGGLIITGELATMFREFIDKDRFYNDFKISDKMEGLLKDIPLYFIFNNKAILQGAAVYGAFAKH